MQMYLSGQAYPSLRLLSNSSRESSRSKLPNCSLKAFKLFRRTSSRRPDSIASRLVFAPVASIASRSSSSSITTVVFISYPHISYMTHPPNITPRGRPRKLVSREYSREWVRCRISRDGISCCEAFCPLHRTLVENTYASPQSGMGCISCSQACRFNEETGTTFRVPVLLSPFF